MDGIKCGHGTLSKESFYYTGQFANNASNGQGEMTFGDGRKLIGNFVDGRLQGKGTETMIGGEIYIGTFDEHYKRHGEGVLQMANGATYQGKFKHGEEEKGNWDAIGFGRSKQKDTDNKIADQ